MLKQALRVKRITIILPIATIVSGCILWQLLNSRVAGDKVDLQVQEILQSAYSLGLTNSWRTMNASGGLVGSPFYSIRWRREYFVQKENDRAALEILSSELRAKKHHSVERFLSAEDDILIMPHENSTTLAPWWRPGTNSGPMMYANLVYGDTVGYIYGFRKVTNAVIYIHIIKH